MHLSVKIDRKVGLIPGEAVGDVPLFLCNTRSDWAARMAIARLR
jgi:hypothetical protein